MRVLKSLSIRIPVMGASDQYIRIETDLNQIEVRATSNYVY